MTTSKREVIHLMLLSINLQGKKEVDFIGSVYFRYATFTTHYQRQTEGEERF